MNSPNCPLNSIMLGRTAAIHLIIFIANQLFLSNNDIVELGWLEREFETKFDETIFKVGDKSIAPGLIEFSEGTNDGTSSVKNYEDIEKLGSNMIKVKKDSKVEKSFI